MLHISGHRWYVILGEYVRIPCPALVPPTVLCSTKIYAGGIVVSGMIKWREKGSAPGEMSVTSDSWGSPV